MVRRKHNLFVANRDIALDAVLVQICPYKMCQHIFFPKGEKRAIKRYALAVSTSVEDEAFLDWKDLLYSEITCWNVYILSNFNIGVFIFGYIRYTITISIFLPVLLSSNLYSVTRALSLLHKSIVSCHS